MKTPLHGLSRTCNLSTHCKFG